MKKNFFRSAGTFFRAFPHFIIFELLYKLLLVSVGAPAMMLLLKLTMKISQVNYISDEHAWVYLKNPATIAVVILVLLFAAVSSFIELSALTACFSCFSQGQRMSVGGMFRTGFNALRKAFRGGISSFLKFTAFMPLAQFTLSSGVFMMPLLPILKTALKRFGGGFAIAAYVLIQVIFVCLIINYCYSLHYLILTRRPFRECVKESKKLVNGKKLNNALAVILWSLFMLAAAAVITFIVSFILLLFIKGFSSPRKAFFSSIKVLRYAWQIFGAISSFLAAPAILCSLTGRFFAEIPSDEPVTLPDVKRSKVKTLPKAILFSLLATAGILLNFSYIRSVYRGNINLNVGILSRTRITAHRGFSAAAPENTMYAFTAAVDCGSDYIELDVQLSADGQVVVFHDEKLDRTTNGKGKLSQKTYEELNALSAVCRFEDNEEFADAKIPLFSEVLENVGNDILLNVEIKDIGDANLTAEKTVGLIEEYGLEDSCYITSFSYNVLKKVKSLNRNIKTGLIANSAATAFMRLKYIDAVSMNHLLVNASVVNTAHQNGKRIFVWTVDNTEDMKKMIAIGVDNIITNRPDKASELVYTKDIGSRILTVLKALFSS